MSDRPETGNRPMGITDQDLIEEASALALEVRLKDRLISRLQARLAELEQPPATDGAHQPTTAGS
jgi:hypothetical protein